MPTRPRNHYDQEFKKQAVLHHINSHGTLADSAKRFGITAGMLSKWVDSCSQEGDGETIPAMNYGKEIKRLQNEIKALKDIVAKALLNKCTADGIVEKMADDPERILSAGEIPLSEP